MAEVGLREMRQRASDLVKRAESGERITVTVAGRPAAILGPVVPDAWRSWDEVGDLLGSGSDPEWSADMDRLDHGVIDPWSKR